jgi:membrane fusion protein, type I secretion system
MTEQRSNVERSVRRHLAIGITVCGVLIVGLGGWAATAELSGAVIGSGILEVESNVKAVQHPQGGVVGEIDVEDGDFVGAGDVVIRLDDTQIRANLGIVTSGLDEASARMARLTAEQTGLEAVKFPEDLTARADDPDVAALLAGEQRLFELRLEAREGEKARLKERIQQFHEEVRGLEGQVEAKGRELALIQEELDGLRDLFEKELVSTTRVKALEREEARLGGERNQLIAAIAQAKGKISETELQIIQLDKNMRSDATRELSDLRAKAAEYGERRIAALDQLARVDVRSPQDGMVHQLTVHTVGGVISPGEVIMHIVPKNDSLIVETKIAPTDIDQLQIGQAALLRLSAFNQRTTPEIEGTVSRISADLSEDDRTGAAYYTVIVSISEQELSRLSDVKLLPGMPVEVFFKTAPRTALSYLTKPLFDSSNRAFREN